MQFMCYFIYIQHVSWHSGFMQYLCSISYAEEALLAVKVQSPNTKNELSRAELRWGE